MANVIRLVLTVVFGLFWMWVYTFAEGATVLVIFGSILTLCVCCCRAGDEPKEWSWDHYFRCLRRCRVALLILIIALILIGLLWPILTGGAMPAGAALTRIVVAAIGSVLAVRLICCLYGH